MAEKFKINVSSVKTTVVIDDTDAVPPCIAKALWRQRIVERWRAMLAATDHREAATRRFLGIQKRLGKPISRGTLYIWDNAFKKRGLEGLIDGRTTSKGKGFNNTDAAMQQTSRHLLNELVDRLNPQGLAFVTLFASMLANRRRTKKRMKNNPLKGLSNRL